MGMLDNLIILTLIAGAFTAGIKLANWYNRKNEKKILEEFEPIQFVDGQAYAKRTPPPPANNNFTDDILNTGDFDGDDRHWPIDEKFMENMNKNGRATTRLKKKADLAV